MFVIMLHGWGRVGWGAVGQQRSCLLAHTKDRLDYRLRYLLLHLHADGMISSLALAHRQDATL